ncbi:MAG TPA: hypothetical protein ENH87_22395 [Pricia antarctica]|uniref:Uncharacterized protein n=1 Tax=Pricia antarctica TaxID=641691 RepID=A0A831VTU7_9FLAO|nr:hypothetical protein [Pricia antarctica]
MTTKSIMVLFAFRDVINIRYSESFMLSLTTSLWQKKAYGAFSRHMLLRGPVEAKDADRPPWLPQGLWLIQV